MCVEEELERGTLKSVPVEGLSYERTIWATYRAGAEMSDAAAAFLKILRRQAANPATQE
jgi:DNA-binding transcriptional LysR family regulator